MRPSNVSSPFSAVSRICTNDTTISNIKIEVGTHIQIDTLALNVDPVIWGKDAAEFRPERCVIV